MFKLYDSWTLGLTKFFPFPLEGYFVWDSCVMCLTSPRVRSRCQGRGFDGTSRSTYCWTCHLWDIVDKCLKGERDWDRFQWAQRPGSVAILISTWTSRVCQENTEDSFLWNRWETWSCKNLMAWGHLRSCSRRLSEKTSEVNTWWNCNLSQIKNEDTPVRGEMQSRLSRKLQGKEVQKEEIPETHRGANERKVTLL